MHGSLYHKSSPIGTSRYDLVGTSRRGFMVPDIFIYLLDAAAHSLDAVVIAEPVQKSS